MQDSVLGLANPLAPVAAVGSRFAKAGISVTDHALHQLVQRLPRGVTEEAALRAYNRERLFFDPYSRNFIRYDTQTGVAVVVNRPSGGRVITVFEGNIPARWIPVRWRSGR